MGRTDSGRSRKLTAHGQDAEGKELEAGTVHS